MEEETPKPAFKTPILIGKIGKLPKQILQTKKSEPKVLEPIDIQQEITENQNTAQIIKEETTIKQSESSLESPPLDLSPKANQLPYKEPEWSGKPPENSNYALEILKQGSIIGNLSLQEKSYWIFGRLPQCDISMAHPTISRFHAILQYRKEDADKEKKGYYLYDLGSTHGTFLNKLRLKPQKFVRVQVGHMIKLGCSSRSYILIGPDEDQEEESQFTITELKQKRQEELTRREELAKAADMKAEEERIAREKRDEERGVDWGMGEDADVESDLAENPYAKTNNEDLYIDDPKKALRGFMEREGVEFEYDCTEQGMGQFLCKVVLPIDDERGRSIVAEVLHKGKKKEAVVQCALEACRILDRHGILRQATHESKKRKAKNWQENDFYDSDDDTFLDRTGTIERKRENRMKQKQPQKAETYQGLLEKEKTLSERINLIQSELNASQAAAKTVSEDVDSLDSFMAELKQPKLDKEKVMQLKTELVRLKLDHAQVIKLVNIARPADLPPLTAQYDTNSTKAQNKLKFPMFGKRLKVKVDIPKVSQSTPVTLNQNDDDDDEEEERESEKMEVSEASSSNSGIESIKPEETNKKKKANRNEETRKSKNVAKSLETKETLTKTTTKSKTDVDLVENDEKLNLSDEQISKTEDPETKRKKNQRRIAQREEKLEKEKRRGYEEDRRKEDYNMWVPPANQTGDGKTSLNEKFGY